MRVNPAVGSFVEAYALQAQLVAVSIAINRVEHAEGFGGQVLGGRDAVKHHRLVVGKRFQKVDDQGVARVDQEGMVPKVDQVPLRQRFDFGEIHHHAVGRIAALFDDAPLQRDLDGVAMPVQVAALALVVRDAMAGVEFKAAGDEH